MYKISLKFLIDLITLLNSVQTELQKTNTNETLLNKVKRTKLKLKNFIGKE